MDCALIQVGLNACITMTEFGFYFIHVFGIVPQRSQHEVQFKVNRLNNSLIDPEDTAIKIIGFYIGLT